jgi:O-antigen ligase
VNVSERAATLAGVLVCTCVLAAAAGSSIQPDLLHAGRPARWALLALLSAAAAAFAVRTRATWSVPAALPVLLGSFAAVSLASVAWSVHASGTAGRAVAQLVVFAGLVCLAGSVAASPRLPDAVLDGVLAAAAIVAGAGFVYWLVAPSHAVAPATVEYGARYVGIEQNPNTASALFAIAIPLAAARLLRARSVASLAPVALVLGGLVASVAASGSRGGLLGAFVGTLAVVWTGERGAARRAGLTAAAFVVLAIAAWVMTIPAAVPGGSAATSTAVPARPAGGIDAERYLPLSQEVGHPWWTHRPGGSKRSLFNTSVRLRAWRGTLERAADRPLVGYGFGAEQWAFTNRYYAFSSENPENGYLGLFLQLGLVGVLLFAALAGWCLLRAVRARRAASRATVAALGGAVGGLGLAVSQSFFHGAGSIEYLAFWIALVLAGAATVQTT